MAFPVVATSASNAARGGNGSGIGNLKPASLAVGDLLISGASAINGSNGSMTISAPATGGWTTIHTGTNTGLFWKIATSTETAASDLKPQFSGGTNSSDACGAFVLRITGADPATPVSTSNFADTSGTSLVTSGISPTIQSLFIIAIMATVNDSVVRTASGYAVANSNPSWSELLDTGLYNNGTSTMHIAVATANETGNPASATGNASATVSLTENATIAILAIQPPKTVVATPLSSTGVLNTPTFVRRMVVTSLALAGTLKTPTVSIIDAIWSNLNKNVTTWINQSKS